jgi:hypothetical protein
MIKIGKRISIFLFHNEKINISIKIKNQKSKKIIKYRFSLK